MGGNWYSRRASPTRFVARSSPRRAADGAVTDGGHRPAGRSHTAVPDPVEMGTPIRRIRRLAIPVASVGAVAQLGERLNRTQEADGSIPFSSTTSFVFFSIRIREKRVKRLAS